MQGLNYPKINQILSGGSLRRVGNATGAVAVQHQQPGGEMTVSEFLSLMAGMPSDKKREACLDLTIRVALGEFAEELHALLE